MWYHERMHKSSHSAKPKFMVYYGNGKVEIPLLKQPPEILANLLFDQENVISRKFQQQIRVYNMMFVFTSPGQPPKFSQLFTYDTENEVQNQMQGLRNTKGIDPLVVQQLSAMLYEHNTHAKRFKMAKQWLNEVDTLQIHFIAIMLELLLSNYYQAVATNHRKRNSDFLR
ncbi:unnamed protein product [Vicia faba]|uniref:Uncharacterized protein n=1 Tax=Vicia faba TaxID=3906 RepID=A0AAV0YV85_VICFA|nr:unnamed protein product [Vicia faba]